ncbi:MAG TPA: class I SAM-dependent methyltransferase [Thermoleophilaceae bacterium]|nr:class I SAM-dependent methyltransferase [Thermoleophilaceae bacterium]
MSALRAELDELRRKHAEELARANQALSAAQEKSYWLDRFHVDLNALMRSRVARELRTAVRSAQGGLRAKGHRRALSERLRGGRVGEGGEPSARELAPDLLHASPVSDSLYDRLTAEDLAAIDERLEPSERELLEAAGAGDRKRLALAFAAHHRVHGALERTGLSADMPTDDVPTMARGPVAAGGSYYYADLVVDALQRTGFELEQGHAGLDFGCSSGRVVRVLAAAHPEVDWHGCDPLADAIAWGQAHLHGIRFDRSPELPPLPYADGSFDFVFAISIWSHFSERAALAWLDAMRRALRPRGRLLLTTQGEQTVAHTHRVGQRSPDQLAEIREALRVRGFWYAPEYGEVGDHGLTNPDWGIAFLTPEWLLANATPEWRVSVFHPGRVEGNQDLYVLERR